MDIGLIDYLNGLNQEAGSNLDKLGLLYQDPQGRTTFDRSKWSPASADAEKSLADQLTGAMAGTVNWSGGVMPAVMQRFAGPEIDATVAQRPGLLTLSKVVVPAEQRGQGVGSDFMNTLTQHADDTGQTVALSPSADFGGVKSRLIDFYKGFGFVPNKGRNKDFSISESMLRPPK
jgi:GNAT superfamily N-acetyltransferase